MSSRNIFHFQVGPRGKHRQRIHGQGIDGHVAGALFEFERFRNGIGHHGEAHPGDLRHCGPTQWIALDDHVLVDLLAHEAKRPGAYRVLPEVAPAALRNNAECARGKVGEQKIVGVFQMKNDGALVGSFQCVYGGVGCGFGRNHRAREHRIDRPQHIARRQRAPVVEAHAAAQMKDERQRIWLLPALGQCGDEVKAHIAGHQPIEEQFVDMFRLSVGADARIEVCRTAFDEKDHRVAIPGR